MFIYPIYNLNWRNISTIYLHIYIYINIYIRRLTSNEIFSPSNEIHREVGRAKDLSAPLYQSGSIYTVNKLRMCNFGVSFRYCDSVAF